MNRFINNFLEPFVSLLFLLAVIIIYRRHHTRSLWFLIIYHTLAAGFLLYGSYLIHIKVGKNVWVYDIALVLAALCIGGYFYALFASRPKKRIVLLLIALFSTYAIFHQATLTGQRLFDSIGYAIVSASVTAYVLMYFHHMMKHVTQANLLRDFNFWLSSAYLLYFAGNFIIFVSYYYFTQRLLKNPSEADASLLTSLWGLHNTLFFISALFLLTGSLWIAFRKRSD